MSKNWIALTLAIGALLAVPVMAQEGEPGKALGSVVRGDTTIVFEAASARDLSTKQLETWSQFAQQHPEVARQLAAKSTLLESAAYLKKHRELENLLRDNPDLRQAMIANPGNFVANKR